MDKIKNSIIKFMYGRYGVDEMGKMLTVVSLVMYCLAGISKSFLMSAVALYLVCYNAYRMLSKKIYDREMENKKYLNFIKLWRLRYAERKVSKIYVCKSCGRFIRVPRKKGKIEVRCTVCGDTTVHRT